MRKGLVVGHTVSEKVAIVGISCVFPGANNQYTFWENLLLGKLSIIHVPKNRWDISKYYSQDIQVLHPY